MFYLSILIFHCSHELFRAGIASAGVTSAHHCRSLAPGHCHNRVILLPSHPDLGTVILWIMVTAKWEPKGSYFNAAGNYVAFGESMGKSKSHAAVLGVSYQCYATLSWTLQWLFIPFPSCLVSTGKVMLNGCDGQKLTIWTCSWLALGWGPKKPEGALCHHRHIWELLRSLRALGFPQPPWESQEVFCYSIFAVLILVRLKHRSWIPLPTLVLCSQLVTLPLHPSWCGEGGCPC